MKRFLPLMVALLAVFPIAGCVATSSIPYSGQSIVIIGSSTAAGAGAEPVGNGWAFLYRDYVQKTIPDIRVVNLAVGGYTTYHVLPTGTKPAQDRPAVDATKNITAALAYSPLAIIVNLPINDTMNHYSDSETLANYTALSEAAREQNVPLWVTTTRPANLSTEQRAQLIRIKDWINQQFGDHSIDSWSGFANADGTLNPDYMSGDGLHFNNAGHALLYQRVVDAKILEAIGLIE